YLNTVNTKTHVAIFHTSTRDDGYEALDNDFAMKKINQDHLEKGGLQKLDYINIFSRQQLDGNNNILPGEKPIKTIHFEYDYSLMKGVPWNKTVNGGVLTLTKVYTTYNGIIDCSSKQEWEFDYAAKKSQAIGGDDSYHLNPDFAAKYDGIISNQSLSENPNYNRNAVDRWGAHQDETDINSLLEGGYIWNQQSFSNDFDPAAWQLKVIIEPLGGELHIQYESKEYTHVQQEEAMVMVPLLGEDTSLFHVNIAQLDLTLQEKNDLVTKLNTEYGNKGLENKQLFYQLRFKIKESDGHYEDFDGLSPLHSAKLDAEKNGIYLYLNNTIVTDGIVNKYNPRSASVKMLKSEFKSKRYAEFENIGLNDIGKVVELFVPFVNDALQAQENYCSEIDHNHSFIRIPSIKAKKGDGIRVKRVLNYNPNQGTLYGSEYNYIGGVATYEPMKGKFENPLYKINNAINKASYFKGKSVGGLKMKALSTPLGEDLMPKASVGYSRVEVNNIHRGVSGFGRVVHQFYTLNNQPNNAPYLTVKKPEINISNDNGLLNEALTRAHSWITNKFTSVLGVGTSFSVNNMEKSIDAGYSFIIRNYHGNPISVTTEKNYGTSTKEDYRVFSHQHFTYNEFDDQKRTMDISLSNHVSEEASTSFSGNAKFTIGILPGPVPLLIPQAFSGLGIAGSQSSKRYIQQITSKVTEIGHHVVRTKTITHGISEIGTSQSFDPITGAVLLSTATDEFENLFNNAKYIHTLKPAYHEYKGMGAKYINQSSVYFNDENGVGFSINSVHEDLIDGILEMNLDENGGCVANIGSWFTAGDIIEIKTAAQLTGLFMVHSKNGFEMNLIQVGTNRVNLIGENVKSVEVLKSGYANQLNTPTESISMYNELANIAETVYSDKNQFPNPHQELLNREGLSAAINDQLKLAEEPENMLVNFNIGLQQFFQKYNKNGICVNLPDITVSAGTDGNFTFDIPGSNDCSIPQGYRTLINPETWGLELTPTANFNRGCGNSDLNRPFTCFELCPLIKTHRGIENVLNAKVTTFTQAKAINEQTKEWIKNNYKIVTDQEFEMYRIGRWFADASYTYKTALKKVAKIYDGAGVYGSFNAYNYTDDRANGKEWIRTSYSETVSPDNMVLQTNNLLNIPSASRFGYNNLLPIVSAANGEIGSILFESFEYQNQLGEFDSDIQINSNYTLSNNISHTGSRSIVFSEIASNRSITLVTPNIPVTTKLKEGGITLKSWISIRDQSNTSLDIDIDNLEIYHVNEDNGHITIAEKIKSSRVGEWILIEAKISKEQLALFSPAPFFKLTMSYTNQNATIRNLHIDDMILHPTESDVKATVYDPKTYQPVAEFGNTHFAHIFQYDGEGKLVRERIETEEGIKTVKETYQHVKSQ
ncbi:MAG: hypothetical protein JKY54_04040, partial [Flavobacteriales bacterium]|nr:hypothetical protein [Flavobacteriales bacterium]